MRGGYAKRITEEPGKCGGCKHFKRRVIDGKLTGSGKCEKNPRMWQAFQSTPACKKYEAKEAAEA